MYTTGVTIALLAQPEHDLVGHASNIVGSFWISSPLKPARRQFLLPQLTVSRRRSWSPFNVSLGHSRIARRCRHEVVLLALRLDG